MFDLTVAATGNNEKTLKRLGVPYEVVHIHPSSHAGYYPGATPIDLKLIFDKETGKIQGSINIRLNDLRNRLEELPKDQTIYVNCQVGLRGYLACRILKNNGFKVKNVDGGWKTYSSVYGTNLEKM